MGLIVGFLSASWWLGRRLTDLGARLGEQRGQQWAQSSQMQLQSLLEPFKERLRDFEKKVEDVYSFERTERGSLKGEISKLLEMNVKMNQETQSLSRALRGDVKVQGTWGEILLENILEKSGLRKDEEYFVQKTSQNMDGSIIRPDVVVKLPEGKHLIVDSKVSLKAFDMHTQAESDEEKIQTARSHVESLKKHIDSLAAKKYSTATDLVSPDFVLLFMPLEPAFSLVFKTRPELFQYAWDQNVALVSPTTLLATLRTVGTLWKHERQQKNALEIAKRGGALYDKFAGFVKDLEMVGDRLQSAQKSYESAFAKLSQGPGNLISQTEKLKDLGAKAEKKLGHTEKSDDLPL